MCAPRRGRSGGRAPDEQPTAGPASNRVGQVDQRPEPPGLRGRYVVLALLAVLALLLVVGLALVGLGRVGVDLDGGDLRVDLPSVDAEVDAPGVVVDGGSLPHVDGQPRG